jgi:hypothetical protein
LPPVIGYGMPPSPRNKEIKKYISGESQCTGGNCFIIQNKLSDSALQETSTGASILFSNSEDYSTVQLKEQNLANTKLKKKKHC